MVFAAPAITTNMTKRYPSTRPCPYHHRASASDRGRMWTMPQRHGVNCWREVRYIRKGHVGVDGS